MSVPAVILSCSRSLVSLNDAVLGLEANQEVRDVITEALARGWFQPEEEGVLFPWFARFITVRAALLETIEDLSSWLQPKLDDIAEPDEWRCFILGFGAACLLVRMDRYLVEDLAKDSLTQRKLNEGETRLRIPRKQFTAIFKSLADLGNAYRIHEVMRFAGKRHQELQSFGKDPWVGFLVPRLPELQMSLDPSIRHYLKLMLSYRDHSIRRRGASALQQTTFRLFELGGRVISEMNLAVGKLVDETIISQLLEVLQPGDVLVTRHEYAATNLFLPGFWPHAALYIGTEAERNTLGVVGEQSKLALWTKEVRVLEALKDGVRFRPITETLYVDSVAVIRPRLSAEHIAIGLGRVIEHEGKMYNFDFDFFRSDRLVCTEVIYRAFDGLDGKRIGLSSRAGRPTLSAEDLLDMALDESFFTPVAIYGVKGCEEELVTGPAAAQLIRASYK